MYFATYSAQALANSFFSLPPWFIMPLVFIQAGGLQGEANSLNFEPRTFCADLMKGISASSSRSMEKVFSAVSPACST